MRRYTSCAGWSQTGETWSCPTSVPGASPRPVPPGEPQDAILQRDLRNVAGQVPQLGGVGVGRRDVAGKGTCVPAAGRALQSLFEHVDQLVDGRLPAEADVADPPRGGAAREIRPGRVERRA